ncbi:unnamed protein product [Leptidea sinapis]|uniref:Receptor ligand binding region domain-containing protein n=1 Tax=Leptidea sinapis TaxID=189913 RepID=A0A5E4R5K1_9NEOP|nr:unnamed protein product [Leptidea sinapis]
MSPEPTWMFIALLILIENTEMKLENQTTSRHHHRHRHKIKQLDEFFNPFDILNPLEDSFSNLKPLDMVMSDHMISDGIDLKDKKHQHWPLKREAVIEGDLVLGGLMMVHERSENMICGPVMPQGGVQALETMLYTLDIINNKLKLLPGVTIGAHVLDDCDRDTYGLEMAVDFIKGSISNIDDAEYACNATAMRKVISGVVGAASSVTSVQVRAMVEIVKKFGWSYVSIIYEESSYGIKAFEELEASLARSGICIAVKEKLVKDSGVADEGSYDDIVQKLLTKPRARGAIIFGSDQEVAGVMRAVQRANATKSFSWVGSDGWSARSLVSEGNEKAVEGTISVQPQANDVEGFKEYFLGLNVKNNKRNPWFIEFWEHQFQCRYPGAPRTPFNGQYQHHCSGLERLTDNNIEFERQLQFVADAVMAFAYAISVATLKLKKKLKTFTGE